MQQQMLMSRKAFTLIEVLAAIILIGIAIASLVAANRSFTTTTGAGAQLSTAEFLIEQIKELTVPLDYDNLDDFAGDSPFSPPISADRVVLNDFAAYSQWITVENVDPSNFENVVGYDSSFVKVTVTILLNSRQISSESWIRARY